MKAPPLKVVMTHQCHYKFGISQPPTPFRPMYVQAYRLRARACPLEWEDQNSLNSCQGIGVLLTSLGSLVAISGILAGSDAGVVTRFLWLLFMQDPVGIPGSRSFLEAQH